MTNKRPEHTKPRVGWFDRTDRKQGYDLTLEEREKRRKKINRISPDSYALSVMGGIKARQNKGVLGSDSF